MAARQSPCGRPSGSVGQCRVCAPAPATHSGCWLCPPWKQPENVNSGPAHVPQTRRGRFGVTLVAHTCSVETRKHAGTVLWMLIRVPVCTHALGKRIPLQRFCLPPVFFEVNTRPETRHLMGAGRLCFPSSCKSTPRSSECSPG